MTLTSEKPGSARDGSDISMDNYSFLQRFIHQQSGIVIDAGKHYLLESRLVPILRQEGLSSLNDLCALLRSSPPSSKLSPPMRLFFSEMPWSLKHYNGIFSRK